MAPHLIAMVTCRALSAGAKSICKQELASPAHPLPISLPRIRTCVPSSSAEGCGAGGRGKRTQCTTMEGTVRIDKGPVEEKVKDTGPKKQKRGEGHLDWSQCS